MAKIGRPLKTPSGLPSNWKQTVINLMSEGASKVEIKAELDISNDLFERWVKEEPEFSDAIKKGQILSNAWWEKKARINLENNQFNSTLWYMNMKNRFGWRDKHEVENSFDMSKAFNLPAIKKPGDE